MATIIFEKRDLLLTGTPSTNGYIVGYDLDGVMKQKNEFGVIEPVGYNTAFPLNDVLGLGNNTENQHIVLGTATSILSANGNTYLVLDEGTNAGHIKLKSDLGEFRINNLSSGITASSDILIKNGGNYYSSIISGTQSLSSVKGIELGIDNGDELVISKNLTTSIITKNIDKNPIILSSKGTEIGIGVYNTVVIGGNNLLATQSNTVYLGNNVNINNSYNLPNTDGNSGQLLMTDGQGNTSWSDSSSLNQSLEQVLSVGNKTGTYSITLGTQSSINAEYGNASIFLSHLPTSIALSTDNGLMNTSFLIIRDSDVFLQANDFLTITASTGLVTTLDNHGLQYTNSYDFLDLSLVTKEFVDTATASIWLELEKKTQKKIYTINLVANTDYFLTHELDTTDIYVNIYYNLKLIQLGTVEIISYSEIKLKSSRSLNNVKIILIG
jgi:hypothetical protein